MVAMAGGTAPVCEVQANEPLYMILYALMEFIYEKHDSICYSLHELLFTASNICDL